MLEPVGPLPASVYWRRRGIAVGLVLLVLLLVWAIWPGGDGGDRRNAAAVTGTASPTPGELTATAPANDPGRAADPGTGTSSGGDTTTSAPAPRPTATTPPPAPPKPCGDKALALKVAPAQAAPYPAGSKPVITLTVRNVSKVSCTRDVGAAAQELLLYRGTQRLWSSNDCYPSTERAVRTLRPGQTVTSSVEWSGKLSRPKCAGVRTLVGAGTYALIGRVGTAQSPRGRITLR